MEEKQVILSVEHLMISFSQYVGGWRQRELPVIRDLNIKVREHEVVAVAGSSGSGKSLLAHAVMGLLPQNAACQGTVSFDGEILNQKKKEQLRGSRMVLVPQSVSYLDPLMKVGEQVRRGQKDRESVMRCRQSMGRYGLGEDTEELYPFELSGGMTRRVLISTAVMEHPRLVIADEPTPGLHISAARRVLSHFREIADQGAGVLLITHDLELALEVADRIVVFYARSTRSLIFRILSAPVARMPAAPPCLAAAAKAAIISGPYMGQPTRAWQETISLCFNCSKICLFTWFIRRVQPPFQRFRAQSSQ